MLTFTPYLLPVVVLLAVVFIILVIRAFVKQEGIPVGDGENACNLDRKAICDKGCRSSTCIDLFSSQFWVMIPAVQGPDIWPSVS